MAAYGHSSVTKSQHLNVTSNETIILQCNFDGIESGVIQWFVNENRIDLLVSK